MVNRDNLESLGFKHVKGTESRSIFNINNIMLILDRDTISIFTRDPSKCEEFSKTNRDPKQVNNITIKNMPELKKLLNQLKIEYVNN